MAKKGHKRYKKGEKKGHAPGKKGGEKGAKRVRKRCEKWTKGGGGKRGRPWGTHLAKRGRKGGKKGAKKVRKRDNKGAKRGKKGASVYKSVTNLRSGKVKFKNIYDLDNNYLIVTRCFLLNQKCCSYPDLLHFQIWKRYALRMRTSISISQKMLFELQTLAQPTFFELILDI